MKLKKLIAIVNLLPLMSFAQTDLQTAIKGGEVLISGLGLFKGSKSSAKQEGFCVKNKLSDKITFKLTGKDEKDNDIKKELVIQADGKECLFEVPKGIVYTYEVIFNKETFKKGEFKLEEDTTITIKKDD